MRQQGAIVVLQKTLASFTDRDLRASNHNAACFPAMWLATVSALILASFAVYLRSKNRLSIKVRGERDGGRRFG